MTDAVVADIELLETRRWAAQIAEDVATLDELTADELTYTHSTGLVDDKPTYLHNIANKVFDYRYEKRTDTVIQVLGDAALVTGRAEFIVAVDGTSHDLDARYTVVWVRRDGAWQFAAWQSTRVAA